MNPTTNPAEPEHSEIPTRQNPILWGSTTQGPGKHIENKEDGFVLSVSIRSDPWLNCLFPASRFLAILNSTVETMQWAEAHFFIGLSMKREDAISRITAIAEQAATPAGIEVVEVELKGSGRSHLLRIYIDRPEGVTHADCELVSREVSAALDLEDPIPGHYELEVSSPGVERKLGKWQDWRRFEGKKVKVVLKEALPVGTPDLADAPALKHFDGVISRAADDFAGARTITVELAGGKEVTFPVEQVDHANLKFEW
jgi:ribosome maturation factor RimP